MRVANRAWRNEPIPERISGAPIPTAADGDHFQERIRESTMKLEAPALPGSSGSRHWRFLHGCRLALLLAVIFSTVALPSLARAAEQRVLRAYVGTYTGPKSKGIYAFTFDPATGKAGKPEVAVESPSPSFLAVHPSGRLLYSVGEIGDFRGKPEGIVAGFAIDPATGRLDALGQESSGGAGPCHLVVDSTGKHVLVANYGGGSVAVLPIRDGGKLGPATCTIQHAGASEDKSRQSGPHAHSIHLDAAQRFAFAADLGLDKILVYRWDPAKGTLTPNDPPAASVKPGSGPRHFTFGQGDRHAYAINEMACTVTAFDYDAPKGVLSEIQTISTLPGKREAGYSTAEVVLHPSGKFLYGSNRGHNSIAVFAIDAKTGKLSAVEQASTLGKTPRNFVIDPTGAWLLAENQDSDTIVIFAIDPASGRLKASGATVDVPSPVCVRFVESRGA